MHGHLNVKFGFSVVVAEDSVPMDYDAASVGNWYGMESYMSNFGIEK